MRNRLVFRTRDSSVLAIVAAIVFLTVLLPVILEPHSSVGKRSSLSVILFLTELGLGRSAFAAVIATRDGVVVRNIIRTRRVSWGDIVAFRMAPGFAGVLIRTDGSKMALEGLGVIRVARKRAIGRNRDLFDSLNHLVELAKAGDIEALDGIIRQRKYA